MKQLIDFFKSIFREGVEIRVRLYVVLSIGVIAGVTIQTIFTLINQTQNVIPNILVVVMAIFSMWLYATKKKYNLAAGLLCIIACWILVPLMYFGQGGMCSGMPLWCLFAVIVAWMMLVGAIRYVVCFVSILIYIGCMVTELYRPDLVTVYTDMKNITSDIATSFVVASIGIGILIAINIREYDKQRKKVELQAEELKSKQTELEKALVETEKAGRAKTDFLANMSHEIRAPINAVLGLNEMILRESDNAEVVNYAKDVRSAGNSLLNIINNVLDFSKIESGKIELVEAEYDCAELFYDLLNLVGARAQSKNLELKIDVDERLPRYLTGDENRIRQIMTNIVNNAVKYTEKGGITIKIGYERDGDYALVSVSVADTGIGMKAEDLQKLYKPFERIEEKRNRNIEGTGLGMAITKHFLTMMGSELEVRSTYGVGSTFSFVLRQKTDKWEPIGDFNVALSRLKNESLTYKTTYTAPSARVLIVDDVPLNLKVMQGFLKETGMNITTAGGGKEAVELCQKNSYDLIFMDHMMPEMDGIESFLHIRKDSDSINPNTPVVILTANAIIGAREKYLAAGFTDYLTKPVNAAELDRMIMRLLPEGKVDIHEKQESDAVISDEKTMQIRASIAMIPEISIEDGIENSGGEDTYIEVARDFYLTAADRSNALWKAFEEKDLAAYIIETHTLKSTARILGDAGLSELAAKLEAAGRAEDFDTIRECTGELYDAYRDVARKIEKIFEGKWQA